MSTTIKSTDPEFTLADHQLLDLLENAFACSVGQGWQAYYAVLPWCTTDEQRLLIQDTAVTLGALGVYFGKICSDPGSARDGSRIR